MTGPDHCACAFQPGRPRSANLSIGGGRVVEIHCAGCELPILLGEQLDDFEQVHSEWLPVVMTTSVETYLDERGFGTYEPMPMVVHRLTSAAGAAEAVDVERLAQLVGDLRAVASRLGVVAEPPP